MKLNKRTDYALRTLIYLAMAGPERLSTLDEISTKFQIARDHLIKIVNKLGKLKYISAIRGKGGGLRINEHALTLSLYEIVFNFESSLKVIDCNHPPCPIRNFCKLNLILEEASQAFIDVLKKYSLQDLLPISLKDKAKLSKKLSIPIIEINNE